MLLTTLLPIKSDAKSNTMSFSNKVVIVTGAGSGIGAATGILYSHRGANVVLVGRNENKLKNVAEKCSKGGVPPLVVAADISKDSDAERIIKETIAKYGKLDILINNAGIIVSGTVLTGDLVKAYDEVTKVNVRAVIRLTTLAAPYLIQSKGSIVNISSIEGKRPTMTNHVAYSVSKAAVDHFTKAAALELAPKGVRVNSVSPGPVRTDILENSNINTSWEEVGNILTVLKRVSEPVEIAELILYLTSDKAIGITGSDFLADNGSLLGNVGGEIK